MANREHADSPYAERDDAALEDLRDEPLPWRLCALIIFVGSIFCYALGYGIVVFAVRLFTAS